MWRHVAIVLAGGLIVLPALNEPAEAQRVRCGYFAGMGYRCFGTAGGTGGRIFRQMDYNTRRCGYFNPGCVGRSAQPIYRAPVLPSTRQITTYGYARPTVGAGYVRPTVGPGYRRPGTF